MRNRKLVLLLVLLPVLSVMAGCGVSPLVKPYERQNLADPLMSFNRTPIADGYTYHVYQAREGARGAEGAGGGGCGCN